MATLAEQLRKTCYAVRAIPGALGLRPHTVEIVTGVWSGSHTGEGLVTEGSTPLVEANNQPPKLRWLTQEERALGDLAEGSVVIGPVTPAFQGIGIDIGAFNAAALGRGQTLHLKITGPQHPRGAIYRITNLSADHSMHYTITAAPVANV